MKALFDRWARMWDLREAPIVQALVRLLLGVVVLSDYLDIARLGLVVQLLGPREVGGLSPVLERENMPWFYDVFPAEPWSAWVLWTGLALSALSFAAGFRTRTSALVLLVLSAQAAMILAPADRGIDRLIRNVLMMYVFASGGRTMSVDARLATGSWWGDGERVPAWPRHLLILQLVVMYFTAGVYKLAYLWTPLGRFDALYVILQDPAVARFDWSWLVHQPFLTLTRIGTAVTVMWEWSAPLVLLVFLWRYQGRTTGVAGWVVRNDLQLVWLAVGVIFHIGIAVTLDLGIFPWGMLAMYPVFVHPEQLGSGIARLRSRPTGPVSAAEPAAPPGSRARAR